ncbi:MAG TPA: MarR family winged helix-turn-helix transcriptional regulator [Actinomycetaceae bacterium]|nr:MarR family winged helix-turn-helix transcriptional regulator [Actinomycetaceae bacterium]
MTTSTTGDSAQVPADERESVMLALRSTAPSPHVAEVLDTVADTQFLTGAREQIFDAIERLTDMRLGEIQVLVAVAEGADHYRGIARATGQVDAAAEATVEALVRKGALARHHHPKAHNGDRPTLVHLTPRGDALLAQSEAIRVRLIDAVLDSLGSASSAELRLAAHTLTQTLGATAITHRQIGGPAAEQN